jgi:pSer/pThr/pTyr-binding forkhead associated (FHA) protein
VNVRLPSTCGSRHAILQFRLQEGAEDHVHVRPTLYDLGTSANGTFINGGRIPERCYCELTSGDVLSFGSCDTDFKLVSLKD